MTASALDRFQAEVRALVVPRIAVPVWQRDALQRVTARCPLCDVPFDRRDSPGKDAIVSPIIPAAHGGSSAESNLLLTCRPCGLAKRSRDLLDTPIVMKNWSALLERRQSAAASAWNHPPRHAENARTRAKVDRLLRKRWSFPRAPIAAYRSGEAAYLRPLDAHPTPHVHLILRAHNACEVQLDTWVLPSHAFTECAWALIDANAWLRPVTSQGTSEPSGTACWAMASPNAAVLR